MQWFVFTQAGCDLQTDRQTDTRVKLLVSLYLRTIKTAEKMITCTKRVQRRPTLIMGFPPLSIEIIFSTTLLAPWMSFIPGFSTTLTLRYHKNSYYKDFFSINQHLIRHLNYISSIAARIIVTFSCRAVLFCCLSATPYVNKLHPDITSAVESTNDRIYCSNK